MGMAALCYPVRMQTINRDAQEAMSNYFQPFSTVSLDSVVKSLDLNRIEMFSKALSDLI